LAKYKQPKRVLFVADLPRNAMGKVQKAALREACKGIYSEPGGAATKSARGE
jgi:malonyl-CoA/methylmalonyl-CoA synthetase